LVLRREFEDIYGVYVSDTAEVMSFKIDEQQTLFVMITV
jgi:hypothetical protein